MKYNCIIIGGGAAGLCCAASLNQGQTLILESTHRLGTKLLLTGGGRCNVTHSGSIKDFVNVYGNCGRKLRKVLYKHSNAELINVLESSGIQAAADENGRVFPSTMKSSTILNLLLSEIKDNDVEVRTDSKLAAITVNSSVDAVTHQSQSDTYYTVTTTDGIKYDCDNIVIACGGITYPNTGSDGSIFDILRRGLGTAVTEPHSALAPIEVADYPYSELAGISLSDVKLTLTLESGKIIAKEHGDILFAHRELSGPAILNISRYARFGCKLILDYSDCPAIPRRFSKLRESFTISSKKKPTHRKDESVDEFVIKSVGSNGMITVGGVSLDEINTDTMELKSHPGIYVIGETLDADGPTGGYNLQLAYSTARAAADSIISYLRP